MPSRYNKFDSIQSTFDLNVLVPIIGSPVSIFKSPVAAGIIFHNDFYLRKILCSERVQRGINYSEFCNELTHQRRQTSTPRCFLFFYSLICVLIYLSPTPQLDRCLLLFVPSRAVKFNSSLTRALSAAADARRPCLTQNRVRARAASTRHRWATIRSN